MKTPKNPKDLVEYLDALTNESRGMQDRYDAFDGLKNYYEGRHDAFRHAVDMLRAVLIGVQ